MLLKREEAWRAAAVVSGAPKLESEFPLANTDILDKQALDNELTRSFFIGVLQQLPPQYQQEGWWSLQSTLLALSGAGTAVKPDL